MVALHGGGEGGFDFPLVGDQVGLVGHGQGDPGAGAKVNDGGSPYRCEDKGVHVVDMGLGAAAVQPVHLEDGHIADLVPVVYGDLVALHGVRCGGGAEGLPLQVASGRGCGRQGYGAVGAGLVGALDGGYWRWVFGHGDVEHGLTAVGGAIGRHPVGARNGEGADQSVGVRGEEQGVVAVEHLPGQGLAQPGGVAPRSADADHIVGGGDGEGVPHHDCLLGLERAALEEAAGIFRPYGVGAGVGELYKILVGEISRAFQEATGGV